MAKSIYIPARSDRGLYLNQELKENL